MRELPRDIEADVVLAIGHVLDDHARMASVSVGHVVGHIRKTNNTSLDDEAIEQLVVEMAGSRGLSVMLDRRPSHADRDISKS
ncbi:hypothetical protein [Mesorhizobium sp. 113-1-2]|uniref:hypothetical protein n=1 Tax=Mesorhizobium sp. 113-1-2 TaxID=2744515 RepID=UPI000BBADC77|nr:hypothetical protein [Mesorhizobium sp. 113-1-2]